MSQVKRKPATANSAMEILLTGRAGEVFVTGAGLFFLRVNIFSFNPFQTQ